MTFWSKVIEFMRGPSGTWIPGAPESAPPVPTVPMTTGAYRINPRIIPSRPGRVYFYVTGPGGFRISVWFPASEIEGLDESALAAAVMAKVGKT